MHLCHIYDVTAFSYQERNLCVPRHSLFSCRNQIIRSLLWACYL